MKKLLLLALLLFPVSEVFAQAQTGHALTGIISAATNNATLVKASSAAVKEVSACNTTAALKYVKLYNKATAPTCGTDVPKMRFALAANSCVPVFVSSEGANFSTGLGFCIVTGAADNDNTAVAASDVFLNLGWK